MNISFLGMLLLLVCLGINPVGAKELEVKFGLFRSSGPYLVLTRDGHEGNYADYLVKRIEEKGPIKQDVRAKVSIWSGVRFKEMMAMFQLFKAAGVSKFELVASYDGEQVSFKTDDPLSLRPEKFGDRKSLRTMFVLKKAESEFGVLEKYSFTKGMVRESSHQIEELKLAWKDLDKNPAVQKSTAGLAVHPDVPANFVVQVCSLANPLSDKLCFKFFEEPSDQEKDQAGKEIPKDKDSKIKPPSLNKASESKIKF